MGSTMAGGRRPAMAKLPMAVSVHTYDVVVNRFRCYHNRVAERSVRSELIFFLGWRGPVCWCKRSMCWGHSR